VSSHNPPTRIPLLCYFTVNLSIPPSTTVTVENVSWIRHRDSQTALVMTGSCFVTGLFLFIVGIFFFVPPSSRLIVTLGCSVCLTASVMVHPYYSCSNRSSYSNFCASLIVDGFTNSAPCNVNHGSLGLQWLDARGGAASHWGSQRALHVRYLKPAGGQSEQLQQKLNREHVHTACNSPVAPWGSLSPLSIFRNTG